MPTFTLAGDESGDVSVSFGKGASRNFVLTMIATQHPDVLRNDLKVVRKNANLPRNYEFKFHSFVMGPKNWTQLLGVEWRTRNEVQDAKATKEL
jgi:hypothetical protein